MSAVKMPCTANCLSFELFKARSSSSIFPLSLAVSLLFMAVALFGCCGDSHCIEVSTATPSEAA